MEFTHFYHSLISIVNEMSPFVLFGFLVAGFLHVFVKESIMTRHLAGRGVAPVLKAALIGIPLPLCSCSVLPTAVSLRRGGASKGATTSFLIATPQTGVDSIAATYSLLGLPFALIRPVAALVGAVFGGAAVDRFDSEKSTEVAAGAPVDDAAVSNPGLWRKILEAVRYGMVDMVGDMGRWLMIGLFVAALITVFVPDSLFLSLSRYPLLAMLVMVAVAVPMYVCATGSIPIAMSLIMKGLTPGVGFVLLMAGPAANFASLLILRRAYGARATAIYVISVIVTAVVFGLLIDYALPKSWFAISGNGVGECCHAGGTTFQWICTAVLACLLAYSMVIRRHAHKNEYSTLTDDNDMTQKFKINGMNCGHCKARVEQAIASVPGVTKVEIDLSTGEAVVWGETDAQAVVTAVTAAGYDCD